MPPRKKQTIPTRERANEGCRHEVLSLEFVTLYPAFSVGSGLEDLSETTQRRGDARHRDCAYYADLIVRSDREVASELSVRNGFAAAFERSASQSVFRSQFWGLIAIQSSFNRHNVNDLRIMCCVDFHDGRSGRSSSIVQRNSFCHNEMTTVTMVQRQLAQRAPRNTVGRCTVRS
jgi:hypothetical protein